MTEKNPHYFAFDPLEFFGDEHIDAMSPLALGAFVRIMGWAWRQNPPATVPNDDSWLAGKARMTPEIWEGCKQEVLAAFKPHQGDRLVLPWLRAKYDAYRTKANQAKAAAEARWRARDASAMRPHSDRISDAVPHARFESDSESESLSDVPREIKDAGARVLWPEVQPVYVAYPKHRRGSKRFAMTVVGPVLAELRARGIPDPTAWLAARVRAYAGSWVATNDDGRACLGLDRFCDEAVYDQDDGDWAKPGSGGPSMVDQAMALAKSNERRVG